MGQQPPPLLALRLKLTVPSRLEVKLHWFCSVPDFAFPVTLKAVQKILPREERRN